jgi:surface antigen
MADIQALKKRDVFSREYRKNTGYVFGYCTYYVASEIPDKVRPNWGNARDWPTNDSDPVAGGIVKTRESRLGHVAIVKEVKEETIIIREMNYVGYNIVSTRELDKNDPIIQGYIN